MNGLAGKVGSPILPIVRHFRIISLYRMYQEERAKLREGVLMLNYTDITQNTYIQS